jgi:hypothetical protein
MLAGPHTFLAIKLRSFSVSKRVSPPTGRNIQGKRPIERRPTRARARSWTVEDQIYWQEEFLGRCSEDPAASRAWSKIVEAKLANVSKRLLWEYSLMSDELMADLKRQMDKMKDRVEALSRAHRVASDRSSGPRPEMFAQRLHSKVETAAGTPWCFRNRDVRTLADAATNYESIGTLPIDEAASTMSKSGDAVRRYAGKPLIAVLRAGARSRGVSLSPNELAALATCADPGRNLDSRSLRRFLKLPSILAAETEYRELFVRVQSAFASLSQ